MALPPKPVTRLIERDDDFRRVVDELLEVPAFAVDTEFHREKTYYPRCAMVQIAWPGRLVLIDPLAVGLEPLAALRSTPLSRTPAEKRLHVPPGPADPPGTPPTGTDLARCGHLC